VVLRDPRVTSALIGVSSVAQLEANVGALQKLDFTADDLSAIDRYASEGGLNIWARSSSAPDRTTQPIDFVSQSPRRR